MNSSGWLMYSAPVGVSTHLVFLKKDGGMRTIHRRMSYAGLTFHSVCKEITSLHTVRLVETFVVRISVFSCEMNHIPGGFRYRRLIPKLEAQQRALWKVRGADTTLFLAEHPPTPPQGKDTPPLPDQEPPHSALGVEGRWPFDPPH